MPPSPGYPLLIDRRVFVPMADGTRIGLTVYLPDAPNDGPFPAVIESVPYRKDDDCTARDHATFSYLAATGIAGIRIDIRGTGASTGIIEDEYTAQEQADSLAIMDWAEAQAWCTGNLGMWGISWGGFSALQTAMLRPRQLKAIAAMHATHDRFACDVHYTGGSLHAAEQVEWPTSMVATNALPPDPDIFGEGWFEEWMNRLESTPQWPLEWLRHQRRDDYWLHGSPIADYGSIAAPTLLIGGWLDGYVDGMLELAKHLTCPTRTVIGPWGHHRPATGEPGPTLDHFDLLARWFGHHLRGDANQVMAMPALTAFIRTSPPYEGEEVAGYWRAEPDWPAQDGTSWTADLADLAHSATAWAGPQWVGAHAPAWDRSGLISTDPSPDDEASMAFTSAPLEHPMEILGIPEVELTLTTDQDVGLVTARLLAVPPEGPAHLICRGGRNLAFPRSLSEPRRPTPGESMTTRFPLLATSAAIPAGWRVRLSLAGADFPIAWPPGKRFTLKVDPSQSRLHLPVVPSRTDASVLDIPPAGEFPIPPVETWRSDSGWSVRREQSRTTFERTAGSTEYQSERGDLTYVADQTWGVSVEDDDPASTLALSRSVLRLQRPGWHVETNGSLEITADEFDFHVAIELTASFNGDEVFRRRWVEEIEREWA